jgi:acyl-CoA thioester hydrolase
MAKQTMPTVDDVAMLPIIYRSTVVEEQLDAMGHMNIRYYVGNFDSAAWIMFESFGMSVDYYKQNDVGMFALEQHLRYVREARLGEEISIRFRLVGLNAKRSYFMMFMVNETRQELAATFESLGSFADLRLRRTAPFPADIHARMLALYEQHQALPWAAPLCGSIVL